MVIEIQWEEKVKEKVAGRARADLRKKSQSGEEMYNRAA